MMPETWKNSRLEDVASKDYGMVDGPFGSNLPASLYINDGIPVVRGSNLSLGEERFKADEFVFVSEETYERLERSACKPGDIIFTKKGTLGQTGILPSDIGYEKFLISSNQMKLTVDSNIADPLFVYYYVSSSESRDRFIRESTASGVPKTNLSYLRKFPIVLPPLPEQRAIARILTALDDKIELNRRMNHILEEMARALFKSWFVDFDPVIAKAEGRVPYGMNAEMASLFPTEFEETSNKDFPEIPKGWKLGTFGDIAENTRRGVSPKDVDSEMPYIGLEHMPRRNIALNEWGRASDVTSNKFAFKNGEVLFGKLRPYFHKVGVAPLDGVCSTDVLVISPKHSEHFGIMLGHISSVDFVNFVDAASEGTKMPRTNWETMARFNIALPDMKLSEAFTQRIVPMINRIRANILESRSLASIRDSLLPKLMSGEVRVKIRKN